jgi:hypothetical protein
MSAPRPFSWGLTALGSGIINVLINAPIGWFMVPAGTQLGIWTVPGVAGDLVATAFGIAFGTALVVTWQTRNQVARGQLLAPQLAARWHDMFAGWPRSSWIRGFNLGVWCVLIFTPLPLLALYLLDVQPLDRMAVTLLKGSFSFVVGGLVTPVIAAAATVPTSS